MVEGVRSRKKRGSDNPSPSPRFGAYPLESCERLASIAANSRSSESRRILVRCTVEIIDSSVSQPNPLASAPADDENQRLGAQSPTYVYIHTPTHPHATRTSRTAAATHPWSRRSATPTCTCVYACVCVRVRVWQKSRTGMIASGAINPGGLTWAGPPRYCPRGRRSSRRAAWFPLGLWSAR